MNSISITNKPDFNGLFYQIKDNDNQTRGYLLGTIHRSFVEGTKQPIALSTPLIKRFDKTASLILEVNPLQEKIKDAINEERKNSFSIDYELAINASKHNKEIVELETLDFHASLWRNILPNIQLEQTQLIKEITARVLASEKYEKCELFERKVEQLHEYLDKKCQLTMEILEYNFLSTRQALLTSNQPSITENATVSNEEKTQQRKEYKKIIKELTNEINFLQQDEEIIRCREKIQKIYNERNNEILETMKRIYEISDEVEINKLLKFMLPEAFKECIEDRNMPMADKIDAILKKDQRRHFIAPGTLHLIGEQGIIALLRAKGWKVEQIKQDSLIF